MYIYIYIFFGSRNIGRRPDVGRYTASRVEEHGKETTKVFGFIHLFLGHINTEKNIYVYTVSKDDNNMSNKIARITQDIKEGLEISVV